MKKRFKQGNRKLPAASLSEASSSIISCSDWQQSSRVSGSSTRENCHDSNLGPLCVQKRSAHPSSAPLTRGLVAVGLEGDVVLLLAPLGPRDLLHLVDLGQAELGVVVEEELPAGDGQVVLAPVPQLAQVLVVQGVEGIVPGVEAERTR